MSKSTQTLTSIVTSALTAGLVTTAPVSAQGLEEVVVTAQKREQSLQEIPVSVQALTDDMLDAASMRDFNDVITLVPGASEAFSVSVTQRAYQIRGIFSGDGDDTVGYYINDAAYFLFAAGTAPIGRVFDMDRVEVLRGPQGTLYGNGSMGGTVRFITKKPNLEEFEVHTRVGYSEPSDGDNGYYLDGAVSVPLIRDTLALRFTGSTEQVGGYQTDPLGNEDVGEADITSYRGELLWDASDVFSLSLFYSSNEGEQDGGTLLSSLDPPLTISLPGDFRDNDEEITSLSFDWDLGFATLTSTTTSIDFTRASALNVPLPGLGIPGDNLQLDSDTEGEAFNNETRLVSTGDSPLNWIVGLFYSDTEVTEVQNSNAQFVAPDSLQEKTSEAISYFGEISYAFMDGKVVPLVGVRYFEDERDAKDASFVDPVTGVAVNPKDTFDSVNPRFNLSLYPTDSQHYYLNVAKGFRSGDFNNPAVCQGLHAAVGGLPCQNSLDSDELWSYEVGSKLELAGNQLLLELAGYYTDWQDVRQAVTFSGVNQGYSVGDAEIIGLDATVTYIPAALEGFTLQASANWAGSEFTDLDPAIDAIILTNEGDDLPLVPDWTLALLGSYSFSLGGDWQMHVSSSFNFIGEQAGLFATTAVGDERKLLRARIGASNDNFGVYLFGNNLLDEDGAIFAQNPSDGLLAFTQDYPRQVGVEVTFDFN